MFSMVYGRRDVERRDVECGIADSAGVFMQFLR
jgi:hypothetical protein